MVQGINPAANNQMITPAQMAEQAQAQKGSEQQQNPSQYPQMQMMPSMPMPAQVNMPQTVTQPETAVNQEVQTPQGVQQEMQADPAAQNLNNQQSQNGIGVLNPPEVSSNPLNDRYGFIKDDPYGLKNPQNEDTQLIASQGLNLFPENSAYYNPDKPSNQSPLAAFGIGGTNGTTKQSGFGNLLKTAALIAGSVLLFKSLKGAKGSKVISENLNGAKETVSKKIVREFEDFQDFFTDTMDNLADLTPKKANNIKLNLSGRTIDETKEILDHTRQLATEYSRLPGLRPKYVVYLKEGMESSQDSLIDALKRNDLSGISDDIISGIEEINLISEKISPCTELQNNIIFNPVVRENFSTHNNTEMLGLAGKNLRNRILNFLSR